MDVSRYKDEFNSVTKYDNNTMTLNPCDSNLNKALRCAREPEGALRMLDRPAVPEPDNSLMPAVEATHNSATDSRPKQILLLGATFLTQNMGVGALAAGAIRCLLTRYPGAHIRLLDYSEEASVQHVSCNGQEVSVPLINMRFSKRIYLPNHIVSLLLCATLLRLLPSQAMRTWLVRRSKCLQQIDTADLVTALSGGDSFSDIYGMQRLLYCALPQILVLLMGKQLVLLPQTLGPFRSTASQLIARFILRHATLVYARDYKSLAMIEPLVGRGFVRQKYSFSYDLGFVLDSCAPSQISVHGMSLDEAVGLPLVGLNVSGLLYMGGYSTKNMFGLRLSYSELMDRLIDLMITNKNTRVLLIPHVFGADPENDVAACEKVFTALSPRYGDRLGLLRGSFDQSEVKHVIGHCDFFIGSRMHACIAALSQCVPCVPIAYSDKFLGVIGSIDIGDIDGIGPLVADARKVNTDQILEAVDRCYENRTLLRNLLQQKMPAVRRSTLAILA
jgi:colanic acid/amylovoran biosynthesis protein